MTPRRRSAVPSRRPDRPLRPDRPRGRRRDERGYVAIITALLLLVLMGVSAFAVDVGHWYLVGQRLQRAADAAALAGVTKLPGDRTAAYATATTFAAANGASAAGGQVVAPSVAGGATRMRVDVTDTVDNIFGGLLGINTTQVSRHAVAEFAGPVPLGSPCNRFGDDPDPGSTASPNCGTTGNFFAMVGSRAVDKTQGDAFQNGQCSTEDGCSAGTNSDYDVNGYTYTVTLRQAVTNLKIEVFDPAQIVVGAQCTSTTTNKLQAASQLPTQYTETGDPSTRYQVGAGDWCTGDSSFVGSGLTRTKFTIRNGTNANPWEPTNWPTLGGSCQPQTFEPFSGDLSRYLDTRTVEYQGRRDVARNFRRWVTLCTIGGVTQPGTYAVQVQTNGLGTDTGQGGHNRFSLRASGTNVADKNNISVAGFDKMALFANTPNGTSLFYLARIPTNSSGQFFNVNLFDIGDGAGPGSTARVVPPSETGGNFSGCIGKRNGVSTNLTNCTLSVTGYNGKWQTIVVPIPPTYSCTDSSPTGCWVKLELYYGAPSQPTDTTSWRAALEGDPIRLVE